MSIHAVVSPVSELVAFIVRLWNGYQYHCSEDEEPSAAACRRAKRSADSTGAARREWRRRVRRDVSIEKSSGVGATVVATRIERAGQYRFSSRHSFEIKLRVASRRNVSLSRNVVHYQRGRD